jgi:hypothetical protein
MDHSIKEIKNKSGDHPGINRERVEKKIQGDQKDHMIKDQKQIYVEKDPEGSSRKIPG